MNRKVLSILGVVLLIAVVSSCSSNPEKGLLDRYFNALSLNDNTTLRTMAIAPATFDFTSYEILTVSEEVINPFSLKDMDDHEKELKKQQDDSVGVTLDARDELDNAVFERNNARSRTARAAAQKKVDELQEAYDTQRDAHDELVKQFNAAREAASKEEEIANFSLGGDYPTIREFVGEVLYREVDIKVTMKDGTTSDYKVFLRRYVLEDEAQNIPHRGRWIIVKFEKLT
jgi:hypothetical protein